MEIRCGNCFINYSSQWRKNNKKIYCNSCGIWFKRKKVHKNVNEIYAKILMSLKNG